jgi:hypothetical protein
LVSDVEVLGLRIFKNRLLRKEKNGIMRSFMIHTSYIAQVMNSRIMKQAEHVAYMGRREIHMGIGGETCRKYTTWKNYV